MGGLRVGLCSLVLALCALSHAGDASLGVIKLETPATTVRDSGSDFFIVGGLGRSLAILGSEELRYGYTLGLQYEVPKTKLRILGHNAKLVLEGYYGNNSRGVLDLEPPSRLINAGILAFYRFRKYLDGQTDYIIDIGWGLAYGSQRTRDLDSRLNSTPSVSLWISHGPRDREVMYGLRFMHISNAGTVGHNQGQNQVYFAFGFRL